MTRVFDHLGAEKDLVWLAREYDDCTVLPANTDGVTEVWRLQAIFCTEGPATFKMEVRNKQGQAVNNQPVTMTWPDLDDPSPDLDDLTTYENRWSDRGKVHRTNMDGLFGFGLGGTYGPFYHAWVLSSVPSDCLSKTGMKGGTNHRGPLHGVWQLEDVEPEFETLNEVLLWHGEKNQVIQFNPGAAIQKEVFLDGFVPNSPEFTVDWNDRQYVAQRAEHLGSGEVRIYYCSTDNYNDVRHIIR